MAAQGLIAARAAREMEWTEAAADHPSLARDFGRVQAELARLGAILREHDVDPGDAPSQLNLSQRRAVRSSQSGPSCRL